MGLARHVGFFFLRHAMIKVEERKKHPTRKRVACGTWYVILRGLLSQVIFRTGRGGGEMTHLREAGSAARRQRRPPW